MGVTQFLGSANLPSEGSKPELRGKFKKTPFHLIPKEKGSRDNWCGGEGLRDLSFPLAHSTQNPEVSCLAALFGESQYIVFHVICEKLSLMVTVFHQRFFLCL